MNTQTSPLKLAHSSLFLCALSSAPPPPPPQQNAKQNKSVTRFLSGWRTCFYCDSVMAQTANSSCCLGLCVHVVCTCVCVHVCAPVCTHELSNTRVPLPAQPPNMCCGVKITVNNHFAAVTVATWESNRRAPAAYLYVLSKRFPRKLTFLPEY